MSLVLKATSGILKSAYWKLKLIFFTWWFYDLLHCLLMKLWSHFSGACFSMKIYTRTLFICCINRITPQSNACAISSSRRISLSSSPQISLFPFVFIPFLSSSPPFIHLCSFPTPFINPSYHYFCFFLPWYYLHYVNYSRWISLKGFYNYRIYESVPVLSNDPLWSFSDQRHLSHSDRYCRFPRDPGSLRMEPYMKAACYV